ncbi:MAG: lipoyl(octanoyl) transferase LipB [Planctomycetota bacterium]|jgi:lipoyl(octanoyl) transferase|nr:lipoyl(octanoyl) transferase LipB [Planctomycetota bacterium]
MPFSVAKEWEVRDISGTSFADSENVQNEILDAHDGSKDTLLLCEFEPVLTVGRAGEAEQYKGLGLPIFEVARGGKATFHGPGQLVAYPIIGLKDNSRDLHAYLNGLEEALIRTAADFALEGTRDPRNTGCWVNGRKLASIGVAVRRWVTYHGVAINVMTDLDWFRRFDPCGMEPDVMTSFARELNNPPSMHEVKEKLARNLRVVLREKE